MCVVLVCIGWYVSFGENKRAFLLGIEFGVNFTGAQEIGYRTYLNYPYFFRYFDRSNFTYYKYMYNR